ncbi:MAG: hypothetical protein SLAVMIC_00445 [uncultured marine phage]|uniref:Uncharacterized protein n=1 Tax=uncultured marine phage TaxID=707152 RepID=A0A8D9CBJ5_9VIRU|nr:MAG: hypothetical protein SLAVMIC_00445 [uncultured marine phage]
MRRVTKTNNTNPLIPLLEDHPVDGKHGDLYFNTTDNQIYCHSGKKWEIIRYGTMDPGVIKQVNREERLSQILDKDRDLKVSHPKKDDKNID